MDAIFKRRRPCQLKIVVGVFMLVLLFTLLLWLGNYKWQALIPIFAYPFFMIYQGWKGRYILKSNGDLIFSDNNFSSPVNTLNVQEIEVIEYTLSPGRKPSIMLQTKQGFRFLDPAKPEEMIHAITQLNPTVKVELTN